MGAMFPYVSSNWHNSTSGSCPFCKNCQVNPLEFGILFLWISIEGRLGAFFLVLVIVQTLQVSCFFYRKIISRQDLITTLIEVDGVLLDENRNKYILKRQFFYFILCFMYHRLKQITKSSTTKLVLVDYSVIDLLIEK